MTPLDAASRAPGSTRDATSPIAAPTSARPGRPARRVADIPAEPAPFWASVPRRTGAVGEPPSGSRGGETSTPVPSRRDGPADTAWAAPTEPPARPEAATGTALPAAPRGAASRHGARTRRDRLRSTAWLVAVAGVCLVMLVVAASLALRAVASASAADTVERVAAEVAVFSETAVDPATGGAFQSAERFIEVYLSQRVAGRGELLAGTANGGAQFTLVRGAGAHDLSVLSDDARRQVLTPGSAGMTSSPGVGSLTWRTVQVHAGDTRGFLAVVVFHDADEAAAGWPVAGLAALAGVALVAIGLTGWRLSGRPARADRPT